MTNSRVLSLLTLATLALSIACSGGESSSVGGDSRGIVVVNAPVAGQVRRVLVREGMSVEANTPVVEIAVQTAAPAVAPSPGESAESRAERSFKAADAEIEAARAEVVRHQAEVERLTPLVASGDAPQGQLDGERALYDRAQQRLQQAQSNKRNAETGLLAARQPGQAQGSAAPRPAPREQIVPAVASAAGTVSAVSARVGDRVNAGQPLATLRASQP